MPDNTGPYITLAELKAATDVGTLTDPELDAIIARAEAFLNLKTRNVFKSVDLLFKVEGNNTSVLHLGIPILSIEFIKINNSQTEMDLNGVTIYNNRGPWPDDRRNPRIKLYRPTDSIFAGDFQRAFIRGSQTEIKGKFGFLEPDGSTPELIKRATLALAIYDIKNPMDSLITVGGGAASGSAQVKKEKTDLHEIEFFEIADIEKSTAGLNHTGVTVVDEAIKAYRAPVTIRGSIVDVARSTLSGYGVVDDRSDLDT